MRHGVEAAGDDAALEPDQATTTHVPISFRMVPPLRRSAKPPFFYIFSMTVDLIEFTMITSTAVLFGRRHYTWRLPGSPSSAPSRLPWALPGRPRSLTSSANWAGLTSVSSPCSLSWCRVPAYGCFGFIVLVKHNLPFGRLTTSGEMFDLSIYFDTCWKLRCDVYCFWTGFVYVAFQSYVRACYAGLIPKGEEVRWYALTR